MLVDCVAWVEEITNGMSELKNSLTPGERGNDFPFAMVYGGSGSYSNSSISGKNAHGSYQITVEIHYPLDNIRNNMSETNAIVDAFMTAFRAKSRDLRVGQIGAPTWTRFTAQIDRINTHGPVFTIPVSSEAVS